MPILGIDPEKCTACGQCVRDCPALLFAKTDAGQVEFTDPNRWCIECGHCIAVCPEDAIRYEGWDDVTSFPGIGAPAEIVEYETMYRVLRAHRSIRQYQAKPVPRAELEKVFEAMRYAPSSSNSRPWKFLVLSDPTKIAELGEAVAAQFEGLPGYGDKIKAKRAQGRDPIFLGAPHVIIVYGRGNIGYEGNNAGIVLTYGMLAAQALGLGTCWIGLAQLPMARDRKLRKLAGVRGTPWGVMTIGYPAVHYARAPPRDPLPVKGLDDLS